MYILMRVSVPSWNTGFVAFEMSLKKRTSPIEKSIRKSAEIRSKLITCGAVRFKVLWFVSGYIILTALRTRWLPKLRLTT